jgi:hypothetical protein
MFMTFKEHFFMCHPNAPRDSNGDPVGCASYAGYIDMRECNEGTNGVSACERCWSREMPDMKIDRTDEYERQAEEFRKVCVAVGKKIHYIDPINKLQIALAIYLKVNSK